MGYCYKLLLSYYYTYESELNSFLFLDRGGRPFGVSKLGDDPLFSALKYFKLLDLARLEDYESFY